MGLGDAEVNTKDDGTGVSGVNKVSLSVRDYVLHHYCVSQCFTPLGFLRKALNFKSEPVI